MSKSKILKLKPNTYEIEQIREKVEEFLKGFDFAKDTIQTQKMIIEELVQSGMKIGNLKSAESEISICLVISDKCITTEVKSPVDETCDEKLRQLDKTIQFIRGYQDPFEAYLMMGNKVATHGCLEEVNALELARVAYLGQASLDFYVSADNVLNQSAVKSFATKPA